VGFNNMLSDCTGPGVKPGGMRVDFAAHAAALGCGVVDVPAGSGAAEFRQAYQRARSLAFDGERPVVVVCRTHPGRWTESGAWWEVGVGPALAGRADYEQAKAAQLRWTT
jgi:3D-(3,5/4)-trihydroxycyclohexane-1,2-dione acylhydrolase (decyclizing)